MLKEELLKEQNGEMQVNIPENIRRYQRQNNVDHPRHYEKTCSIECIEAMEICFGIEAVIHFCKCNAFKYLWRYKNKNGQEDLEKALWYCNYGLQKIREFYQDSEYIDEQIDTMVKKAYSYMGVQNGTKQNRTDNEE